jgi:hypothetical protein
MHGCPFELLEEEEEKEKQEMIGEKGKEAVDRKVK